MGFVFSDKLIEKSKKQQIPVATAQKHGCRVCSLNRVLCHTPKMDAHGSEEPLLYVLGGFPDATADQVGRAFSSQSDTLLTDNLFEDEFCRYNTVVSCKAPTGKAPNLLEVEACRSRVTKDIEASKPKIVLGIGKEALYWVLQEQKLLNQESPLSVWHGLRIPIKVGSHTCWFIPLRSPQEVIAKRRRNKRTGTADPGEHDASYKFEINEALEFLEEDKTPVVEEGDYKEGVEWTEGKLSVKEFNKVMGWIKELATFDHFSFDIETDHEERTGDNKLDIRPYAGTGLILTIALGTFDKTYAFPVDYPGAWTLKQKKAIKKALAELLVSFPREKIGHNLAFDLEWIAFYLTKDILWNTNWKDTQAEACALLNRLGTMSLDVQVFIAYGFNLKALTNFDKSRMKDYPLSEILPYNGMDTKWTDKLHQDLKKRLADAPALSKVADHMNRTVTTLLRGQLRGLKVNQPVRNKFNSQYLREIKNLEEEIQNFPEVQIYRNTYRKTFNPASPHDLIKILTNQFRLDEELKNKKGKQSTDETILKSLDLEFTETLLKLRSIAKKHSTYVKPLYRFMQADGQLHHQYSQFVTTTGRLSSGGATNIQNYPNRKGKELRNQFHEHEGFLLVPADYGQIEARIIAVASQDAYYLKALWEDYDVHWEWAEKIAYAYPKVVGGKRYVTDKQAIKKFRGLVKNQWTFPAFYGSSPYSIAKALGVPINIVMELFDEFWQTFSGVKEWQLWIQEFYKEHNYVESLTGRRRYGPMTFNEMINDPIQGTASDFTVNSMSRLEDAGITTLMNIHDDVTTRVPIEEIEEMIPKIAEIMCSIPYPWVNCPISIELAVGHEWGSVEEVATFSSAEFLDIDPTLQRVGHYQDFLYA